MRGYGVAELIACHFRRTNGAKCRQPHDTLEMRPVASDAGSKGNDIAALRLRRLWARRNKGRASARFQHGERALRDVATDRIEHGVAAAHPSANGRVIVQVPGDDLATEIAQPRRLGGIADQGDDLVATLVELAGDATAD